MIPGIVLAAGLSTRMGQPKANLPIGSSGDTFLTRIVRTLLDAGVEDVVVVVGHEKDAIVRRFAEAALPARFVPNADYESGQLSSLLAGLRIVDRPGVVAALVTLVDVPFVSAETIRAVVDRYRHTRAPVVRPVRGGRHGHPLVIDRALFDRVRHANAAEGAKPVIRAHVTAEGEVDVADEGAFTDVDTPDDYERALSLYGGDRWPTDGSRAT